MNSNQSGEITRVVLLVVVIGLLLLGSLWTLLPFLGALVWAVTIVVATWPLLLWFERRLGGRRGFAVTVMTVLVLLAFIIPFAAAINALLDAAEHGPAVVRDFIQRGLGPPPDWISNIPLFGERLANQWRELAATEPAQLLETLKPYARTATQWLISATGGIGMTAVHTLIAVILVAILFAQGETAAKGVLGFARRMGGERGDQTVRLAGQAVRSVAMGVIVTAFVQSALAGLGLWVSGIPHASLLTAVAFVLCIAQIGPMPILLSSVAWLYYNGQTGWATALLIWSIPVIALDNFLRPVLIRRGVQLPMLLIIAGVIGGLIGFGVIGLFVGPVILAATYTLTNAWIEEGTPAQKTSGSRAP